MGTKTDSSFLGESEECLPQRTDEEHGGRLICFAWARVSAQRTGANLGHRPKVGREPAVGRARKSKSPPKQSLSGAPPSDLDRASSPNPPSRTRSPRPSLDGWHFRHRLTVIGDKGNALDLNVLPLRLAAELLWVSGVVRIADNQCVWSAPVQL